MAKKPAQSARPETKPRASFSWRRRPTPTPSGEWEALEYLASADAVEGGHVHNPVVAALGLVKTDLIRFGIGNMAPDE
jgi:hypothetical protein